jgi:hypothetical protein
MHFIRMKIKVHEIFLALIRIKQHKRIPSFRTVIIDVYVSCNVHINLSIYKQKLLTYRKDHKSQACQYRGREFDATSDCNFMAIVV